MADQQPRDRWWFSVLLLLSILVATGVFAVRPMASYRALDLGAETFELGVIASAYALLAILLAIPMGRLIDRVGERVVIVTGAATVALTSGAMLVVDSIVGLVFTQAALGMGQLMTALGAHTALVNLGSRQGRENRIGLYSSLVSIGHAIGPAVAGGLAAGGLVIVVSGATLVGHQLVFSMALLCGAGAALLGLLLPAGRRPESPTAQATRPARRPSILSAIGLPGMSQALLASVAVLVTVDLLVAYLPAYGEERRISPQDIGIMLAAVAIAQMFARLFLGRLTNRLGHIRLLVASMILPALLLPGLIIEAQTWMLMILMLAIGAALGVGQPLTLVWVAMTIPRAARGLALSLRISANRLGQLVLPATIGATAGQAGVTAIFLAASGLLGVAAVYVLRGPRDWASRDLDAPGTQPAPVEADG